MDPVKLAAYMSSLSQLNSFGNGQGTGGVSTIGLAGSVTDGTGDSTWSKQLSASGLAMEEVNEVGFISSPS